MTLLQYLGAGRVSDLTSYFSIAYMAVFAPICLVLYSLMPKKFKKYFLLIASVIFFWLISGTLVAYLGFAVLMIHYAGLWIERIGLSRDAALAEVEKPERKALKPSARSCHLFRRAALRHTSDAEIQRLFHGQCKYTARHDKARSDA